MLLMVRFRDDADVANPAIACLMASAALYKRYILPLVLMSHCAAVNGIIVGPMKVALCPLLLHVGDASRRLLRGGKSGDDIPVSTTRSLGPLMHLACGPSIASPTLVSVAFVTHVHVFGDVVHGDALRLAIGSYGDAAAGSASFMHNRAVIHAWVYVYQPSLLMQLLTE